MYIILIIIKINEITKLQDHIPQNCLGKTWETPHAQSKHKA